MDSILLHPVTLFLSGIVFGAVGLFALLEFFKIESEWRRGARLWVLVVFLGFILLIFVLAVGRISGQRSPVTDRRSGPGTWQASPSAICR